jgi:hypothetical protein
VSEPGESILRDHRVRRGARCATPREPSASNCNRDPLVHPASAELEHHLESRDPL